MLTLTAIAILALWGVNWWIFVSPPPFSPRWWYNPTKVDARPVIWSLYTRPKDWKIGSHRAIHVPSGKEFWIANGIWFYHLDVLGVLGSRDEVYFQPFQKFAFHRAYRYMRNYNSRRGEGPKPIFDHDEWVKKFNE